MLKSSLKNLLNLALQPSLKLLIKLYTLLIKLPSSRMAKLKSLLKLIVLFNSNPSLSLSKSSKKAKSTINKITPFFKTNNKTIKLLPNLKIKMTKIYYKNEKIAFNSQSLSKFKLKQPSKILKKCIKDLSRSKKQKESLEEILILKKLKSSQKKRP